MKTTYILCCSVKFLFLSEFKITYYILYATKRIGIYIDQNSEISIQSIFYTLWWLSFNMLSTSICIPTGNIPWIFEKRENEMERDGEIIQTDESLCQGKRKYHRGHLFRGNEQPHILVIHVLMKKKMKMNYKL